MDEEGYPPQKHAGAIGLGPEYGKMREATTGDKVVGIKDEIVGKITRNQDKAQHGHEQRTGELKRKKFEEDNNADPFATAEGGGEKEGEKEKEPAAKTDESTNAGNEPSTGVTGKRGPGAHPTEKGAQEQAATTAPEGTDAAEEQRAGENTYNDKQIDESANKKPRTE
ncbi:hypothetical protein BDW22DRAFT_1328852 [Trametopsis cervina]|nr:hypothetical protein BDW22DRAFT_1328852 [Trametopsis cervina]